MSTVDRDTLEPYLVDRIACRLLPYVQWLHDRGVTDVEPWLRYSLAWVARAHGEATAEDEWRIAHEPPSGLIAGPRPFIGGTTYWMHDFWRAWEDFMLQLVIPPPFQPSLRTLIGHALDVLTERPLLSPSSRRPPPCN